jgi:S1-C subfamily serine protease
MRRIHALLMTAGLVAAPASVAAKPDQPSSDSATFEKLEWSTNRGRLGVVVMSLSPELRTYFGSLDQTGVLVARVEPGSPAARAGIAVGDVIVNVRGTKIDDASDVIAAIASADKDQRVSVKVLRDHKPLTVDVTLGSSATSLLAWPPMNWLRDMFEHSGAQHPNCT